MSKFIFIFIFLFSFLSFSEEALKENNDDNLIQEKFGIEEKEIDEDYIRIKDVKPINKANTVTIQTLDKIVAKSYNYTVKINEPIVFKRLIIYPLFCWKSSPTDIPENKALVKVIEKTLEGKEKELFFGWIFSSSPSINGIEHSMYDIKLVDCKL